MMSVRRFARDLKSLYAENDLPSDRLIRDQKALEAFTREFNSRVRAAFGPEDISAEIERIRKDKRNTGGLPRLGRNFSGPRFLN